MTTAPATINPSRFYAEATADELPNRLDGPRIVTSGVYAGHILKGAKPAGPPVMQSTKFEFAITCKPANI